MIAAPFAAPASAAADAPVGDFLMIERFEVRSIHRDCQIALDLHKCRCFVFLIKTPSAENSGKVHETMN